MIETVFNILKITVIIAVAAVMMTAIVSFLNLIQTIVFGNIIYEILALASMYLPFDALAVFGTIGVSIVAILSFMIAKKIFDLTSWSISSI